MALPVMKSERRRSPRRSLGALAYINFESNSGGIVVNVSNEGLCFHTVTPVQRSGTIRFWFSAEGRRIEAEGQLVWTDETRKTGGLRFNTFSAEASRQIRNWLAQSSEPVAAARQAAVAVPPSDALARPNTSEPNKAAAPGSGKPREFLRWVRTLTPWSEFSRGLATGILIAAIVGAAFLFHTHKRQFGESLILLGEHFGATPSSEPVSPAPSSLPPSASGSTAPGRAMVQAPTAMLALRSGKALSQPATKAARPAQVKPEPQVVAPTISATPSSEPLPSINFAAESAPPPPEPGGTVQPESTDRPVGSAKVIEAKPASGSLDNAEDIAELNSGVPFGKYFDVGRFRDELRARSTTDDLAHAGFHAIVIHKHVLWMNSYEVLAGPYRDPGEAQIAIKNLHSHGFKTHSLPRRSRDLTLLPSDKPYTDVPAEDFIVSWEAYGGEVTVNFVKAGDTVAKAQGRWVRRPIKYDYDAIEYKLNDNGSRTLLGIRFRGANQAIVLPTTSGNQTVIF